MLANIGRFFRDLRRSTGGNAALLVGLGMPALIGGTGIAVDISQWYMWKRELQYAVDQAALAGAWARTDDALKADYVKRAKQEFTANSAMTTGISTVPNVSLANYAGGTQNSVAVSATASQTLPFSSFLTGRATTVYAFAQAKFGVGSTFTSCLIAVDKTEEGTITIGGSSVLTASCGMAALSTSPSAIIVNGNPQIDAGWVLSAGGIDDWFDTHTDDEIHENLSGLFDPFAELSPPNPPSSQVARTYNCTPGSTSTTADKTVTTTTSYSYWKGSSSNNAVSYPSYSPKKASTSSTNGPSNLTVPNGTAAGTTSGSTDTWTKLSGSGQNTIWEKKTTATSTTYSNVVSVTTKTQASLSPGTYTDMKVSCRTVFSGGVYVINGGSLQIDGQHEVAGAGVMFVLKGGASIQINGGANVNLTAMTATELVAQGVSAANAAKLAGMLVFEDRSSTAPKNSNKINGNATTILNGTIYLPNSNVTFSGTAGVTSQCLMIAAKTINITGNANMSTFCPPDRTNSTVVATEGGNVKLVI